MNIRRKKIASPLLRNNLKGMCWLSVYSFIGAYICYAVLWRISFNFLLKLFMKGVVYVILPLLSGIRIYKLVCNGSTLHMLRGGPVTIKKPAIDPATGFPAKWEGIPFLQSRTEEYSIPQRLCDVANWLSWFHDGQFETIDSGAGRIARKPFACGNIRNAFYLTLDGQPNKL